MKHYCQIVTLLVASAGLCLQSASCSHTGSSAVGKQGENSAAEPLRITSVEAGTRVVLTLMDGSMVRGWFEGVDVVRPRRVIMLLARHLPEVVDTLREWDPVPQEPILVHLYPSYGVFFRGVTDTSAWQDTIRSRKGMVLYMTPDTEEKPLFNVRIRYMPDLGTFSRLLEVPADRIAQVGVDPEQTVSRIGQVGIGLGIAAAVTASALGIGYYLMYLAYRR